MIGLSITRSAMCHPVLRLAQCAKIRTPSHTIGERGQSTGAAVGGQLPSGHLVGAYGMFWERGEVNWWPGSGPAAWQLLGRVNKNKPKVRVCDFRKAQGFYVLFDDFRANYVGLARGNYGIGAR